MTIDQILKRIELDKPITINELQRLERRWVKVNAEVERIASVIGKCYRVESDDGWVRRPDPSRVIG